MKKSDDRTPEELPENVSRAPFELPENLPFRVALLKVLVIILGDRKSGTCTDERTCQAGPAAGPVTLPYRLSVYNALEANLRGRRCAVP
jgi:hypothetical protein